MDKPRQLNNHIYIYVISQDKTYVIYERSMPRDVCPLFLDARLKILRGRGQEPFYTVGAPFPGAFY